MPLSSGTRLGPYEIQAAIGAGGMGEVYRARDTRLDRTVAIKVLPAELSADPDRRARFEREARAVAALTHPHICTLHDIGQHDGVIYLVMEHLAGESLAERLHKGRLPLDQALSVATDIADALTAAHKQGIIHRDLKPGNVMLTKAGAKLLDFGLAKLAGHGAEPAAAQLEAVATRSAPLTVAGTIVGTLQYMAPEQLEGKQPDARTDLWALGAVLYEMVTGRRAFEGTSAVGLMAAIMGAQPAAITTLQPLTPSALDRVARHCLEKDPAERFQSAQDVVFALTELRFTVTTTATRAWSAWRWPVLAVALALALLAGGFTGRVLLPGSVPAPASLVVRSSLAVTDTSGSGAPEDVTISPDGRTVVFVASAGGQSKLYARRLDDLAVRPLPGTEDALGACFSPDGSWIAFMTRTGIRRVKLSGGPPVTITNDALSDNFGMEWGEDGNLIFARGSGAPGLWRVSVKSRGPIEQYLKAPKNGIAYYWPRRIPGSDAVLFTRYRSGKGEVVVLRPGSSAPETLLSSGAHALYLPATGHLVYKEEGNLLAVRFDARRLVVEGDPFAVVPNVGNSLVAKGEFDVSRDGTLVHLAPASARLVWKSRRGSEHPLGVEKIGTFGFVVLSPDGQRAVVTLHNAGDVQLWLAEQLEGGGVLTRLTPGHFDWFGVFTPDGRRLLFTSPGDDDQLNIYAKAMDTNAPPERQTKSPDTQRATSISRDGRFLFNNVNATTEASDVWEQKLDQPSTARPLIDSPAMERYAAFSPNERWIAYESDISGAPEVYVQQYPNGAPHVVSVDGGGQPIWSRNGDEVFYQRSTRVFAVRVVNGARVGPPTKLFDRPAGRNRNWDTAPDNARFLVADNVRPGYIQVVTNWFEELRAKVPAGGAK